MSASSAPVLTASSCFSMAIPMLRTAAPTATPATASALSAATLLLLFSINTVFFTSSTTAAFSSIISTAVSTAAP